MGSNRIPKIVLELWIKLYELYMTSFGKAPLILSHISSSHIAYMGWFNRKDGVNDLWLSLSLSDFRFWDSRNLQNSTYLSISLMNHAIKITVYLTTSALKME